MDKTQFSFLLKLKHVKNRKNILFQNDVTAEKYKIWTAPL